MSRIEYTLVSAKYLTTFEREVNDHAEHGWIVVPGTLQVLPSSTPADEDRFYVMLSREVEGA